MKAPTRKALAAVAVVLIAAFGADTAVDACATAALKGVLGSVTGAPVSVRRVSVGVSTGRIDVRGLMIGNPRGFPKGTLADVPSIGVDADLGSFLAGKPRLKRLAVDVREVVVVKNKEGLMNVDALKVAREKEGEAKQEKPAEPGALRIDQLVLSVGRVVSRDFSKPKPFTEVYEVGIREAVYENIPGAEQLVAVVLVQSLQRTAIQGALIYGTAAAAGVALLPVGAAVLMAGKDDAQSNLRVGPDKAYSLALKTVRDMGEVVDENKREGTIKAKVAGADVTVSVRRAPRGSDVQVNARKLLLPQPRIAGGVLYEIADKAN